MQCSEGCSISYHPACWRKFKSDCVVGADRDFLTTPCPTPDCEGTIKALSIYDSGKRRIRVRKKIVLQSLSYYYVQLEGETASKKTAPNVPPTSLSLGSTKESKRSLAKHAKKKSSGEFPDTPQHSDKVSPTGEVTVEKGGESERDKGGEAEKEKGGEAEKLDLEEDVRRVEDSLAVINRQAEQEGEVQVGMAYLQMCRVCYVVVCVCVHVGCKWSWR